MYGRGKRINYIQEQEELNIARDRKIREDIQNEKPALGLGRAFGHFARLNSECDPVGLILRLYHRR
jgi:hypothetical protein